MHTANLLGAKTSLFRLVKAIEQGQQREIMIARNGRPVAKLVPIDTVAVAQRIGIAQGKFDVPDSIDAHNIEVAHSFMAGKQCCKKEYM